MDFVERPSPNFDERALPVSMIVLHYTGMPDAEGALDRLTSPEAKVSCHYLVDEDGVVRAATHPVAARPEPPSRRASRRAVARHVQ